MQRVPINNTEHSYAVYIQVVFILKARNSKWLFT